MSECRTLSLALLLAAAAATIGCGDGGSGTPTTDASPVCGTGTALCGAECVNTDTDRAHCGGCAAAGGTACAPGEVCSSGTCGLSCGGTTPTLCGTSCTDTDTDRAHCGGCAAAGGTACAPGEVCNSGTCGLSCGGTTPTLCGTSCTNTDTDRAHCGGCAAAGGTACGAGEICTTGICTPSCSAGLSLCAGMCTDTVNDPANCGACGTTCGATETCYGGRCWGIDLGCDPFDTADSTTVPGWTEQSGDFLISGGRLYTAATGGGYSNHITMDGTSGTSCATTRATYGAGPVSTRSLGIVLRWTAPNQYIVALVQDNSDSGTFDSMWIYEYGPSQTRIAGMGTGVSMGTDVNMRASVTGTTVLLEVDSGRDGTYDHTMTGVTTITAPGLTGTMGLATSGEPAFFDDFCPACL